MLGIALEGGAERCAYTAGVLDQLLEYDVHAGAIAGTSAGAGCAMAYCTGQQKIALDMMKMSPQERYFGVSHLLEMGKFVDLLCMAQRFARDILFERAKITPYFTATCCETGKATYLDVTKKNFLLALMASCALPVVCPPVEIEGKHYVDGSIAAPIPYDCLFKAGCDRVIVVLTGPRGNKPTDYRRFKPFIWKSYHAKYPALYAAIMTRLNVYDAQMRRMEKLIERGKIYLLRPQTRPISLFTQDNAKIDAYYQHAREHVKGIFPDLRQWLSG